MSSKNSTAINKKFSINHDDTNHYAAPLLALTLFGTEHPCSRRRNRRCPTRTDSVVVYGEGYRTTGTKSELEPIKAPMSDAVYDAELLDQRQGA